MERAEQSLILLRPATPGVCAIQFHAHTAEKLCRAIEVDARPIEINDKPGLDQLALELFIGLWVSLVNVQSAHKRRTDRSERITTNQRSISCPHQECGAFLIHRGITWLDI